MNGVREVWVNKKSIHGSQHRTTLYARTKTTLLIGCRQKLTLLCFQQFKETKAFSYSPGQRWRNPMLNATGFLLSCKGLLSKLFFFFFAMELFQPPLFCLIQPVHTHTNVSAQWRPVCSVTRLCFGHQTSLGTWLENLCSKHVPRWSMIHPLWQK